ncbi:tetratricopeptide repeat protein [Schlesneria sp.]|uniref:tetratricopeptide repeat protein n=1 Tax=Schlesneria sp. TaxID=2762018 RepID=UPI002F159005
MWRSRKGHEPTAPQLSLLEYFTRVPTYQKLFAAFPAITVTAGPVRDISLIPDPGEDLRFLSNLQQRTSVSYLMTAEEVSRSGIPHSLLFSYPEIVSDLIQREVGDVRDNQAILSQVAAVLLPGRTWQFDVQVLASNARQRTDSVAQKLRRKLEQIPTWPVAYPIVFVVRRSFGRASRNLQDLVIHPFEDWSRRVVLPDVTSFCEMALKVYEVEEVKDLIEFRLEDCQALIECSPKSVKLKLLHANGLQILGRVQEELEVYDRLIEEYPDDGTVVHKRIMCLSNAGQLERAASECQRRLERHPEDADAFVLLANLQLDMNHAEESLKQINSALAIQKSAHFWCVRANILSTLGRTSEALSSVNVALMSDFDCSQAYLLRAKFHLQAGRTEQALKDLNDYERCVGLSLDSIQMKAEALAQLKRIGEAEQVFRSALDYAPENVILRMQWAEFLGQNGKLESARQECDQILNSSDRFGAAFSLRAAVLLELGHFEESIHDADKAIELMENSPKSYMIRGLAKASLGRVDEGLDDLDTCLTQDPRYSIGRLHRGRLRAGRDECESAIDDFTDALETAPDWVEALLERGYALLKLEEHERAREDFDRVIELAPERADGYTGRGITYLIEGKKAAAASDLDQAIELDPSNLNCRLNRAKLLLELTEMDLAKEDLNEILAAEPENGAALWQRAYINLYQGQFAEAQQDFDRVIELNPNLSQSLIGRSVAFEFAGDVERAEADREEARRLEPFSTDQLNTDQILLTASVAAMNEQFEKAIELATKVIEEHADPPAEAYRTRGHSRWYIENFVDALDDYAHIIENTDDATRHDYSAYGQILCELGEYQDGLVSVEHSIEIAREEDDRVGLAYSVNGQGRALAGMGLYDQAECSFAESYSLKPDNPWLHFYRGLMYVERDDTKKAFACFEQALSANSPKLPPAKRRRALGYVETIRKKRVEELS